MTTALKNFLHKQAKIASAARNIQSWNEYEMSIENVETLAPKFINNEFPKGKSLEYILASKSPSISDAYRFDYSYANTFDNFVEMMKSYQNKEPIILYRGASEIPFKHMLEASKEIDDPNIFFYEKGFLSCSLIPEKASKYDGIKQLKIFVPPYHNVLYVGHALDQEEATGCRYEVIVQRGAKMELLTEDTNYYYCLLHTTF